MTSTHCISYAYPTSPAAKKLGHERDGCFELQLDGKHVGTHPTLEAARAHAAQLGSTPDRYSLDHAVQLTRNAQQRALSPLETELVDLVARALPFVEDAQGDPAFKTGVVVDLARRMRLAINAADAPVAGCICMPVRCKDGHFRKPAEPCPICPRYVEPADEGDAA